MATARKQPGSKRLSRRSTDNPPEAPAGLAFDDILSSARDTKAHRQAEREAERQEIQKQRDAKGQEQVAIFRLHELADTADPEKAGAIIIRAAAVLSDSADRERLEQKYYGDIAGKGPSHYEDERHCILRLLLDARAPKASAAKIGEQFHAIRELFSRLPDGPPDADGKPTKMGLSLDRLRSAIERLVDVFPRPMQEQHASQVAETLPKPQPKPTNTAPPIAAADFVGPYSPGDLAKLLVVSPTTLRRMRKNKEIRVDPKTTKRLMVHRDDLQRLTRK